jgi:hypothetical protein
MKWHSTKETIKITQNPYYLVKYMDQFGREDIADCVYKNGKFINFDKIIPEELNEVIAWCPFEEIEEYINAHNLWRNRDDECDYFNNLGIIVSTTDDGDTVVAIPAIGKVINCERRFYELYEDGLPVGVVYGWVETGDIWTILDR